MAKRSRDWIKQTRKELKAAEHQLTGEFYEWAEAFGRSVAGSQKDLDQEEVVLEAEEGL